MQVSTNKTLVVYLRQNQFKDSKASRSSDVRYERFFCTCGQCPIFRPANGCSQRQWSDVSQTNSNLRQHYYRNKRSDIDRLTERARTIYKSVGGR
jgi:hypothetical protein